MPRFRYTAVNPQGESLTGEIDGNDPATVRSELLQHGLRVNALQLVPDLAGKLSGADAAAITLQIATATRCELPLVGALRGFSEEVFSTRLRGRLKRVCDALEAGEPLEHVLADPGLRLPPAVVSILNSGLSQTAMNHLLCQTMRASTTTFELRARSVLLVGYAIVMCSAIVGLWLFLLLNLTPQFSEIFNSFGTEVPYLTAQLVLISQLLRAASWRLIPILILLILLLVGGWVAVRFSVSAATRRRLWCGIPIIGAIYRLTALGEFANLLAVMLESEVPLPQAVVWSASGTNDADLRLSCEDIAARLRWGDDPRDFAQTAGGLPAHLQQMLRWSAQGAAGAEPLRSMAQLLHLRAKSLSLIALPILEPILLVAGVISVVVYIVVVFLPLIKLLNDLS